MRRTSRGALLTLALGLTVSTAAGATPVWTPLPPFGGPVSALVAAPGAPATLYAGTRTGGVFHSNDGGATWAPTLKGLNALRILKLAVDPRQPAAVFASVAPLYADEGVGVWRSLDGGVTWTAANHGLGDAKPFGVGDLVFDPFDPAKLYAATAKGLFATRDQGQSWQQVGLAGISMLSLAADPFHPGKLLAGFYQGQYDLFGSTDGGATWTPRNHGIENHAALGVLFFDPTTPDKAIATGYGWPTYLSSDDGATWTKVDQPLISLAEGSGGVLFGVPYAFPGDKKGVLRSTDGGHTWPRTGRLPDETTRVVAAGGKLYASGALGIWTSVDGGATWRPSSKGLSARTLKDLTASGAALYVSAQEGPLTSTDGGHSWRLFRDPAAPQVPLDRLLAAVPGAIYVSDANNAVKRSTDGGATWTRIDTMLGGDFPVLAVAPRHHNILYAGSNMRTGPDQILCHLSRSLDTGRTWKCLASEASISRLLVEPATSILYLAGGGVAALIGTHFEPRQEGLPPTGTDAIAFDPKKGGRIYAATSGGVFKTTDGGLHWKRASQGIPAGAAVHSVAVDPRQTGTVYAGAQGKVYRSLDGGATWQLLGDGLLAGVAVTAITPDAIDPHRLYVVLDGHGIYEIDPAAP
jgi:photosystem II stability/assembly factor-like uncharacterized protein